MTATLSPVDPTEAVGSPGIAFSRAVGAGVEEDRVDWDKVERDWKALIALYNAAGGDNWTNNEGWLTETPLKDRDGVMILRDGSVDGLYLDDNLIGEIPAELANLTARNLYLSKNRLSGEIPERLCSVISLDLPNNQLSGRIPQGLAGCSGPCFLSLHSNQLSGEIPDELGEEPELRMLRLDNNQLSGEIPVELANSTLNNLNIANNQLSGEIGTEWADLLNLWFLNLSGNPLSGCIPAGMKYVDGDYYFLKV